MKIPYGKSDFGQIRSGGFFFADKTPFLPILESAEAGYSYLLFLRPRRFGKSTLVSLLAHYYDIDRQDQFDSLFRGLWIHAHPTPERNRYLVLHLDFLEGHCRRRRRRAPGELLRGAQGVASDLLPAVRRPQPPSSRG